MRIAIDARELHGRPTGVGRYLSEILSAWDDLPAAAAHDVILCAPHTGQLPPFRTLRVSTVTGAGRGTLWEQLTLPRLLRAARAGVLFAPGYTGPLRCPVPMVVSIHDVSFAAHPEWFGWREGLRRRMLTRCAARRAARVLTISEFSQSEIAHRLVLPVDKIDVIYPGVSDSLVARAFQARDANPKGSRHMHDNEQPVVLFVGSLFNRRHIPQLIDGFARLANRRTDVRLEIVGDNRTTPRIDVDRLVHATGAGDRIRVRSYASDEELASLYGRARAFAFLSEYEGFGLTPLEALAAGIPIVVLDTPVAREVYGPAAIYVDRPEPALIDAGLERALSDEGERVRVLDAATTVLARYSWRDCAARVLDVLLACGAKTPGLSSATKPDLIFWSDV